MNGEAVTVEREYTENERAVRARFVTEYLVDHNPHAAAIRVGYAEAFARSFASQFMQEPFVLRLMREEELKQGIRTEDDMDRRKVIAGLYKEANYNGPGSSHSGRVAAWGRLSTIFGLDAPVKTQQEVVLTSTGPDVSHLTVAELEAIKSKLYTKPTELPGVPAQ